jgi:hypothetical protein
MENSFRIFFYFAITEDVKLSILHMYSFVLHYTSQLCRNMAHHLSYHAVKPANPILSPSSILLINEMQ